jgi:predicted  nucleic acid-binding Zn-ribbon protein
LERGRLEARTAERAVDDKRAALDRIRGRVDRVQNQKQYSAASLEFDLVKQDLRKLEDRALEKMQVVEELESRVSSVQAELDVARAEVGPLAEEVESRRKKLDDELAILRDRRNNLAIRIDGGALALYNRIRSGRSAIALAPLTDESVCGNCYTAVTVQQEMQIKGMSTLVCCEGCGVILYPQDVKG